MVTKVATEFLTFWNDVRGGKLVPEHRDIHLERLEGISPRVIYSTWDHQSRLVIDYVGTELVDAFGADITGMDQMTFSHPDEVEVSKLTLDLVGDHPCGIVGTITLRGEEHTPREYECVYLPIGHDGRNRHILELVNPLDFDFHLDDDPGSFQALRYSRRTFIDLGAGTPPLEGLLANSEARNLEDLFPE